MKDEMKKLWQTVQEISQSSARSQSLDTELVALRTAHEGFLRRLVTIEGDIHALRQNGGAERREAKLKTLENLQHKVNEVYATISEQDKAISQKETEIMELRRMVETLRSSSRDNAQAIAQLQSAARPLTTESVGAKGGYYDSSTTAGRTSALEKKIEEVERQTSVLKVCRDFSRTKCLWGGDWDILKLRGASLVPRLLNLN